MTAGKAEDRDRPISLVLIEDNALLRTGIVTLLKKQPDITVAAAPTSVGRALSTVRELKPRVVLLDCGLTGYDSVHLAATVHTEVPEAKVVGMGLLPLQKDVAEFVQAGASGFIMKNAPIDEVLTTIRTVARGVDVVPPQLTLSVYSQVAMAAAKNDRARMLESVRLTSMERQILALAGDCQSNEEIAAQLVLPLHAVKSHMQNLMEKLALRLRLDAHATHSSNARRPAAPLPS